MRVAATIVWVSFVAASLARAGETEELVLNVNDQTTISGVGVRTVSVANPLIADVAVSDDNRSIFITGKTSGRTTLTFVRSNGRQRTMRIAVRAIDVALVVAEIKTLLRAMEGVTVSALGPDRVRIDGSVYSERDLERVRKISGFYGAAVLDLVELDPLYVRPARLVELEFTFAEIRRNDDGNWGIDWGSPLGVISTGALSGRHGAGQDNPGLGMTFSLAANLASTLNFLTAKGWATVVDTHRIMVMDGTEAKYQAGGQLNVITAPPGGVSTGELRTISFGTILEITPRVGRDRVVRLTIGAEVSSLDETRDAVTGVPPLRTNRIETDVTVELGQSVALSGLATRSEGSSESGVILLNNIPILGHLFKTEEFQDRRVDGVVFITPRFVDAKPGENRRHIDRVLSAISEARDD